MGDDVSMLAYPKMEQWVRALKENVTIEIKEFL